MSTRRFAVAVLLLLAAHVAADHTEQRYYSILVDGKEAGQAHLTVVEGDDGSYYATVKAAVKVNSFIGYRLELEVQEWWKQGRLIGLKSAVVENDKKREFVAAPASDVLRVRMDDMDRVIRADVWATTFWKLADAKFHNKAVPLIDVESGADRVAQLQFVGNERLPVANVPTTCYRFRITGAGHPIDLWYDQHHRLVRQEFTVSGRKTIVQLLSRR